MKKNQYPGAKKKFVGGNMRATSQMNHHNMHQNNSMLDLNDSHVSNLTAGGEMLSKSQVDQKLLVS